MTFNLTTALAVGFGGFLGAITRFYVGIEMVKHFPHEVPFATLAVNVAGSFIIGILIAIFILYTPNTVLKLFLVTGFLGALTTYSTFAIESFMLLNSNFWYGVLNIVLNLFGTIIAAGSGYKLITFFLK
ncbi:fluoride efflux transporter CrcB [Arcobacteraceae bacterium]|jgi:CrcB protein|nr:fluoride efflux transporter CrcB [Arcobacteraceae bacterium]